MAWFNVTTPATDSYREFIRLLTAIGTSQHVSAAAVNAGGSGYVVGDEITISHASGVLDLVLRVTSVSAGAVTGVKVASAGAFANRVATIAIGSNAGTGYAVDDIVEIQTGTSTLKAKAIVTTVGGGGDVTGIALFEDGGAYSVLPTTATDLATVGVGPDGFAGDDALELQVSTTQAVIGTTGIAQTSTTGVGTGATFDLTLTDGGWSALRNRNNFSHNSLTDELEVVLQGTVSSGDAPIVGMRSYTSTDGINNRWGVALYGMSGWNSALSIAAQYGAGPGGLSSISTGAGSYLPFLDEANQFWVSLSPRKFAGVVKADGSVVAYHSFYIGLGNQFGAATENPYPMVVAGSTTKINQRADESSTEITSIVECARGASQTSGPVYAWRWTDNSWLSIENKFNNAGSWQVRQIHTMYPLGQPTDVSTSTAEGQKSALLTPLGATTSSSGPSIQTSIAPINRTSPSRVIYPAPGTDDFVLYPLLILSTPTSASTDTDAFPQCELDNVFWFSGTKAGGGSVAPEDYFETAGFERYRIFPTGALDQPYLYFCLQEA
jgi:hypothetical protein